MHRFGPKEGEGDRFCLARVVESATIVEVELMLPGYAGVVCQDSNPI